MRILSFILLSVLVPFYSYPQGNVPIDSTEKTRYEKWIADIAYVENEFLPAAKTYTDESRDSCSVILSKLKQQIDALSDFQIRLELPDVWSWLTTHILLCLSQGQIKYLSGYIGFLMGYML
ncbi:MAG: hypothetical protein AAFY70_14650 [Bacteroidota bacterium]